MKYQISTEEADFEPSSKQQVLKNKLGIISPDDMFEAESELLKALYIHPFREGNGRMSRLLNDVFVTKAAVLNDDYQYMKRLVNDVLL